MQAIYRTTIRFIPAALLAVMCGNLTAAEITLVCTKTSGFGGSPEYAVAIDPEKKTMSVDGFDLSNVELLGTEFSGERNNSRRGDTYGVDRVTMAFYHTGVPMKGPSTYDARVRGRCEKRSASF